MQIDGIISTIYIRKVTNHGSGAVGWSIGPASGRLGVRIPAAKTLVVKTGSDSSTAKRSAIGASFTGPRR